MTSNRVMKALLIMDEQETNRVLEQAFRLYIKDIYKIAEDIYDSCIKDFYAQYDPIKYDRHGYPDGFNLYRANDISFDEDSFLIDISFDPLLLLKYDVPKNGGIYKEKRDIVLNFVMAGLRGGSSSKSPEGWPMPWETTYPNQYSKYNLWDSDGTTLDDIYKDFMKNIMADTKDLFYERIEEFI